MEAARHQGVSEDDLLSIVDDSCALKAPGTLDKRASALLRFCTWADSQGHSNPFPPAEPLAYLYVKELSKLPYATAAKSFREALSFARHVLGFAGLGPALESKRVEGVCKRLAFHAEETKQASPLTVRQLVHLETLVLHSPQAFDRYAAGCLLIALLGRCRWSDLRFLHEVSFQDPAFLELTTRNHKTALMFQRRNRLLPIAVPLLSFGERSNWWHTWKKAGDQLRIDFAAVPFGPLLPAPVDAESLSRCSITSVEATELLRSYLRPVSEPMQLLSSHSCKATLLSWCAKAGVSVEHREILGRHCACVKSTAAIYSRDMQAGALQDLHRAVCSFWDL